MKRKQKRKNNFTRRKARKNARNTAPMVDFFFNTAIKRMENEITLKKEMTKENDFDYSI